MFYWIIDNDERDKLELLFFNYYESFFFTVEVFATLEEYRSCIYFQKLIFFVLTIHNFDRFLRMFSYLYTFYIMIVVISHG